MGGHSSAGRAPALHAGGRRVDPVWLHHFLAVQCCLKYIKGVKFILSFNISLKKPDTFYIFLFFNNLENSDVLMGQWLT